MRISRILVLTIVLLAGIPCGAGASVPLPYSHFSGKGKGKNAWELELTVDKTGRRGEVSGFVKQLCRWPRDYTGDHRTAVLPFKLRVTITRSGSIRGTRSSVSNVGGGTRLKEWARAQGRIDSGVARLQVKAGSYQWAPHMWVRCGSTSWSRMLGTLDYPPQKLGTYTATTGQGLPISAHVSYPGVVPPGGWRSVATVDRLTFTVRLSCPTSPAPNSYANTYVPVDRAFDLTARGPFPLALGDTRLAFDGDIDGTHVVVSAEFDGTRMKGELYVEQPTCRESTVQFSGGWQAP